MAVLLKEGFGCGGDAVNGNNRIHTITPPVEQTGLTTDIGLYSGF